MTRRMIFPILLGLAGVAVLVSLGIWQMQRLAWKEGLLAEITATVGGDPVSMQKARAAGFPKYLPVQVAGRIVGPELHVLVSTKTEGAGYRIISAIETDDGPRFLLDRGYVRLEAGDALRAPTQIVVTGNLHRPDDRNSSTPENDVDKNIWFARDIAEMAEVLGTEPVLIVARSDTGQGVRAMPLGIEGVTNDHLQYAITWFSLALVWLGMTVFLLWRIKRRTI